MTFKHLGLQWLQLGMWYPLILLTKLLRNNCSPFHMSDPWHLVLQTQSPNLFPWEGCGTHFSQTLHRYCLIRTRSTANILPSQSRAQGDCKAHLAQGCKRCWHSKGKAKQWREKPSLKSKRLKHTGGGQGCLWPAVLFWHFGLSKEIRFKCDFCLFSWHAPDLQSLADRGKQESKACWVVCMQSVGRSRQCFQSH